MSSPRRWLFFAALAGCQVGRDAPSLAGATGSAGSAGAPPAASAAFTEPTPRSRPTPGERGAEGAQAPGRAVVTLVAGGDVELGRAAGQRLLRDPGYAPLAAVAPVLATGDVRFVNLEGPLSDQGGETVSPRNRLVFTGPPSGAEALARAGIDVVSTANNHAFDYGRRGLLETLTHLDRVGVAHAGTGPDLAAAWRPALVDRPGGRVAVVAVNDVWNQGPPVLAEARAVVAEASRGDVARAVREARAAGADHVLVSYHGGDEYTDAPLPRARAHHRAAVEAGADVVVAHHPHVTQGIEWVDGRPVLHGLGNLAMAMHRDHPWTGFGYLARVTLARGAPPVVEVCPHRIDGHEPRPLAGPREQASWRMFAEHLRAISRGLGGLDVGSPDALGCAVVSPVAASARLSQ